MRGKDELIDRVGNGQFAPKPKGKPHRFQKGEKRPPNAGRRKGTPNKVTVAVKEFLKALVDDPAVQEGIKARIAKGDTPGFFRAVEHVLGKPKETVEGTVDAKIEVTWRD